MPILAALLLAQAAWSRFDLEGISVELPSAPKRSYPQGAPESVRNWILNSGGDGVGVSLQPSNPVGYDHEELARGLEAFRQSEDGKVVAQADAVLNGWPGLTATLDFRNLGEIRFASYHTDKGIVTVTAGGANRNSAAFGKRVVESLRLSEAFGKGTQKEAGPEWSRTAFKPSTFSAEFPGRASGGMVMASADSPYQPRTWGLKYGNRRYTVTLVSPLKKSETPVSAENRWQSIVNINDGNIRVFEADRVVRKKATFLGESSERFEGERNKGTVTVISEVTTKGDHTIIATAMVPKALRNSPEVLRFFRSFRDEDQPGK